MSDHSEEPRSQLAAKIVGGLAPSGAVLLVIAANNGVPWQVAGPAIAFDLCVWITAMLSLWRGERGQP